VLDDLWHATKKVLVLIEAGTADGFNMINFARSYLLSKYPPSDDLTRPGTYTIAPCPHDKQCPLGPDNICRFLQGVSSHTTPSVCHFRPSEKKKQKIERRAFRTVRKQGHGGQRMEKLVIRNRKMHRKTVRTINQMLFPYSYVILGKVPHQFMNHAEAELAAFHWPRIISNPKAFNNRFELNLCLPDIPAHARHTDSDQEQPFASGIHWNTKKPSASITLDSAKNKKITHYNIQQQEGLDASKYGYLEKWIITKNQNKNQMYADAKRSHFGDLWPWPCPTLTERPALHNNLKCKEAYLQLLGDRHDTKQSLQRLILRNNDFQFQKNENLLIFLM
ncbi:hypothetical protein RFI_02096, partial [Reticulomyxa filosa]